MGRVAKITTSARTLPLAAFSARPNPRSARFERQYPVAARPAPDRSRPGGRQELLARGDDRPARQPRRFGAGRLRDHRRRRSRTSSRTTTCTSASSTAWRRWTSRTCRRSPPPAGEIRGWVIDAPLQPRARPRHPRGLSQAVRRQRRRRRGGRGALLGHRRRPARRLVRRPAGNLPQRHRRRRCRAQGQGSLRQPLQRPRHRLPRAPRLQARGRVPVGRRAADGALGRRRVGRAVHARYRIGFPRRGVHHRRAMASARMVVQGAVNPDEFYVYKPTLLQGKPAILRRSLGSQADPHGLFGQARRARAQRGHARRTAREVLDHRRGRARARAPGADHRAALRAARWTSNGPRTASAASSSSCRRARKR